ncbi:MAG: DUF2007 domain-containing protein [bacterium]
MEEIFLKSFNTVAEAELVKNLLVQYNIKSVVKRKVGGAFGNVDTEGADLFVAEKDFLEAKTILEEK